MGTNAEAVQFHPCIVVGAGLAGITFARAWTEAGKGALLLERSFKPGGRIATRHFQGQPIDYGPAFLHGSHPDFVALLQSLEPGRSLDQWPNQTLGNGRPCEPRAMREGEYRVALAAGLNELPATLALGLDIQTRVRVTSVEVGADQVRVNTDDGAYDTDHLIICTAVPQALKLMGDQWDHLVGGNTVQFLLEQTHHDACLTVILALSEGAVLPDWDMVFPEDGGLQTIIVDSRKRGTGAIPVLVAQATPHWSAARIDQDPALWGGQLARMCLDYCALSEEHVIWRHPHRWTWARADSAFTLTEPIILSTPGKAKIGLAGDVFWSSPGAEAAFLSGRRLAERLLEQ
ncbi:MAG: FAD-dependent oxidoreductase [Myxococcales bacterium]|nr:FAD-dependent oxidoreductase [Myxococcales bacterium]